jgi:hypothetical protein
MKAPHFMVLAQIDQQHSISACRHGIIHLSWARITLRFTEDEFRRLARVLKQANDSLPPSSLRDENLGVTSRPDGDREIQIDSWLLHLSPTEFGEFVRLTEEALQTLGRILTSGMWKGEEPERHAGLLEQIRRVSFSRN